MTILSAQHFGKILIRRTTLNNVMASSGTFCDNSFHGPKSANTVVCVTSTYCCWWSNEVLFIGFWGYALVSFVMGVNRPLNSLL